MPIPEFYPERQGRPDSKVSLDMESRRPIISLGSITVGLLSQALKDTLVTHDDVDDEPVDGNIDLPISSNWAYDHIQEQDEKIGQLGKIIKMLLRVLWDDIDWENVDLDDVDWDEWDG